MSTKKSANAATETVSVDPSTSLSNTLRAIHRVELTTLCVSAASEGLSITEINTGGRLEKVVTGYSDFVQGVIESASKETPIAINLSSQEAELQGYLRASLEEEIKAGKVSLYRQVPGNCNNTAIRIGLQSVGAVGFARKESTFLSRFGQPVPVRAGATRRNLSPMSSTDEGDLI